MNNSTVTTGVRTEWVRLRAALPPYPVAYGRHSALCGRLHQKSEPIISTPILIFSSFINTTSNHDIGFMYRYAPGNPLKFWNQWQASSGIRKLSACELL